MQQYTVGKYTYGAPKVHWGDSSGTKLSIGSFCSIGKNVNIYLGGNHNINWVTTYPFGHIHTDIFDKFTGTGHPTTKGNVVIGNDVWIADDVTIMSGVTIDDGAVIANNSHVVKNIKPYSLVGGNPAKHIRYRFSEKHIVKLMKIQWWNLPDSVINDLTPFMCNDDIETFLEVAENISEKLK